MAGRKRTWTDEQLVEAVTSSISYGGVLRALGLRHGGGTYEHIKRRVADLGLSTEHFKGKAHLRGQTHSWTRPKYELNELLIEGRRLSSDKLKKRLLRESVLDRKCYACGMTEWRGRLIPVELHHVNGDNADNRLENLTLLCPNCHAQTDTYCARRRPYRQAQLFIEDA